MDSQLRQISTLVQERRYDEARAALQPYLRDHPDAANGWYLLSFAAETPAAKKQAIQKALQLAPDNEKYAARATKLGAKASRSKMLPLILGGLVLLGILLVAFVLLRPSATPADATLPTLAVAEVNTQTPAEFAANVLDASPTPNVIASEPTLAPTETLSPSTVQALTETAESTPSSVTINSGDVSLTAESGPLLAPFPTSQSPQVNPPRPTIPGTPPQSPPGQPTEGVPPNLPPQAPSSTPSQTPQPGALTATPVLTGDSGVPVSTPLDIGSGSMRVVGVTRPGSSFITEMGGQAADVPAGQDWVVLEMIVICSGSTNCAPALSNLHVVSAAGTAYAPAPDFNMPQSFGPGAFALGQVWGYAGFRVPTSESGLRLVLSQGDKTFTFALE